MVRRIAWVALAGLLLMIVALGGAASQRALRPSVRASSAAAPRAAGLRADAAVRARIARPVGPHVVTGVVLRGDAPAVATVELCVHLLGSVDRCRDPLAIARSDAAGRFAVTVPADPDPALAVTAASDDGDAFAAVAVDGDRDDVVLHLIPLASVHGHVVDASGHPVAAAVAWRADDELTARPDGLPAGAEVDAGGGFDLRVPAAPIMLIAFAGDDEAIATAPLALAPGERRAIELTVRRPDTFAVDVQLTGPGGQPIAAAELQADLDGAAPDWQRAWFLYRRWARTGSDGHATIELPAGRYRIWHRGFPGDGLADPADDAAQPPAAATVVDVDADRRTALLVERELPIVDCTLYDAYGLRVRPRIRQVMRFDASPGPPPELDPATLVEVPRVSRPIAGPPAEVLHLAWTGAMTVTLGAGSQRGEVTLTSRTDRCEVHLARE